MQLWTDKNSPRIWRCPESKFNGDEPRDGASIYTNQVLGDIKTHGFNGIWMRGRLRQLMQSTILPQLNDDSAAERLKSMQTVIARGKEKGVGTYLFFNEPLALPADDPLWEKYPKIKGASHREFGSNKIVNALCTSTPLVQKFFKQAIESVLTNLPGLAGVILITASEHHSHCWSHTARHTLDDGVDHGSQKMPDCPRCKDREPAELVLELLTQWRNSAIAVAPSCKVLAWNWSWSMWYEDPQLEIVENLPEGIELLLDFERGGQRKWRNKMIEVDEYSLGYPGPSNRFLKSQAAAPRDTSIYAKLQIGTTHEIATVPNLPLMVSLHEKLIGLSNEKIAGTMACWNFGNSLTLNTFAFGFFQRDPKRYKNSDAFLNDLGKAYFGINDAAPLLSAWRQFDKAFANFPFSIPFTYFGPVNDGPAHPLSLNYKAKPFGPSWRVHKPDGDDPTQCLGGFDIDQAAIGLNDLANGWQEGLEDYEKGLGLNSQLGYDAGFGDRPTEKHKASDELQKQRRSQELSCAKMIGLQMRSAAHQLLFHARRLELTGKDKTHEATTLPADEKLLGIMQKEIANAKAALPFVENDSRLGFHQEPHAQMYDVKSIQEKIELMEKELATARGK